MGKPNPSGVAKRSILAAGIFIDLALTMAIPIVAFALLGKWLDQKYGYQFLFLGMGGIFGIAIAMRIVYTRAKEIQKRVFQHKNEV